MNIDTMRIAALREAKRAAWIINDAATGTASQQASDGSTLSLEITIHATFDQAPRAVFKRNGFRVSRREFEHRLMRSM